MQIVEDGFLQLAALWGEKTKSLQKQESKDWELAFNKIWSVI